MCGQTTISISDLFSFVYPAQHQEFSSSNLGHCRMEKASERIDHAVSHMMGEEAWWLKFTPWESAITHSQQRVMVGHLP